MIQTTWVYDTTALDFILANYGDVADVAVRKTADSIVADIKASWSTTAPSDPYHAPAVITHTLEKSIRLFRRGSNGRFANAADAKYWTIRISADYAAALELGYAPRNLLPRPYFRPAMLRAQNLLTKNLTEATGTAVALSVGMLNLYGNGITFPSPPDDEGLG